MVKALNSWRALSILMLIAIGFNAVPAEAGVCDGLTGRAAGICMAATQGVHCDQAEPSASNAACERLAQQYTDATGQAAPPWIVYGLDLLIKVNGSTYWYICLPHKSMVHQALICINTMLHQIKTLKIAFSCFIIDK